MWGAAALPGLATGRTAPIRRIFQHRPDHPPLPHEAAGARPFARLPEPATDCADGEALATDPLKDVADHAGLLGEEVRACGPPAVMLVAVAIAIGRATEPMDRPRARRMEFAPALAFDNLGPFVLGHHPLHWQE